MLDDNSYIFSRSEIYGLIGQMRRGAVSVPSNIVESRRRGRPTEFQNFLRIAFGSGAELETQIIIARELRFGTPVDYKPVEDFLTEITKILNTMTQ